MDGVALAVSIAAVLVAVASAYYAMKVSRRTVGSGLEAEEGLEPDLVALLAALRSVMAKGALSTQERSPRSLETELRVVREFQASTSGLGLQCWAAERGCGSAHDDEVAGRWRAVGVHLATLASYPGGDPSARDCEHLAHLAANVELTLADLSADDVREIARRVSDLPTALSILADSRSKDVLLKVWFDPFGEQQARDDTAQYRRELLELNARVGRNLGDSNPHPSRSSSG